MLEVAVQVTGCKQRVKGGGGGYNSKNERGIVGLCSIKVGDKKVQVDRRWYKLESGQKLIILS